MEKQYTGWVEVEVEADCPCNFCIFVDDCSCNFGFFAEDSFWDVLDFERVLGDMIQQTEHKPKTLNDNI